MSSESNISRAAGNQGEHSESEGRAAALKQREIRRGPSKSQCHLLLSQEANPPLKLQMLPSSIK